METIDAFRDHGTAANTVTKDITSANKAMDDLTKSGIDMDTITQKLEHEGLENSTKATTIYSKVSRTKTPEQLKHDQFEIRKLSGVTDTRASAPHGRD